MRPMARTTALSICTNEVSVVSHLLAALGGGLELVGQRHHRAALDVGQGRLVGALRVHEAQPRLRVGQGEGALHAPAVVEPERVASRQIL